MITRALAGNTMRQIGVDACEQLTPPKSAPDASKALNSSCPEFSSQQWVSIQSRRFAIMLESISSDAI